MTVAIARLLSSEEIGPSKYFEEYSPEAVNAWVNSPSAAGTWEWLSVVLNPESVDEKATWSVISLAGDVPAETVLL